MHVKERMNVLQNEIKQFTMLRLKTSNKNLEIIFIVEMLLELFIRCNIELKITTKPTMKIV